MIPIENIVAYASSSPDFNLVFSVTTVSKKE